MTSAPSSKRASRSRRFTGCVCVRNVLERHRLLHVRAAQLAHPHVDRHLAALEAGAALRAGARARALLAATGGLADAGALAAADALAAVARAGVRLQGVQSDLARSSAIVARPSRDGGRVRRRRARSASSGRSTVAADLAEAERAQRVALLRVRRRWRLDLGDLAACGHQLASCSCGGRRGGLRRRRRLRSAAASSRRPRRLGALALVVEAEHLGDREAAQLPRPPAGRAATRAPAIVAFTRLIGFWLPSDFDSTSWMPASSSTARTPPPAITPVPGEAGFSSTRAGAEDAGHLVGDRGAVHRDPEQVLLGALDALLDRDRHLVRLAVADADDFDFSSPTTTSAVNEKRRPPLTTFATRLISTTRSWRSLPPPRLPCLLSLRAIEVPVAESALERRVPPRARPRRAALTWPW